MAVRVVAVIVDHQQVPEPKAVSVVFDHDGKWYEALDQLVSEYSKQYRGGVRIDADSLELRACSIINIGDLT